MDFINRSWTAVVPWCALVSAFALLVVFLPSSVRAQSAQLTSSSKRMADGKLWTIRNLEVSVSGSYCYDNSEANCHQYGRLYTWDSAQRACVSLGDGWRLPTNREWQQLAKSYGGLLEESEEAGKSAYRALYLGGSSGFGIVLGGGRNVDGQYARLDAHGFYWTASESDVAHAWLYNFGKGMLAVNRHPDMEKNRAFSVRCIRE